MGLLSDTNMRTNEFSDLALAFYVTYLFFELPTGFLMQRLPTAKYLGLNGILLPPSPVSIGLTLIIQLPYGV